MDVTSNVADKINITAALINRKLRAESMKKKTNKQTTKHLPEGEHQDTYSSIDPLLKTLMFILKYFKMRLYASR